MKKAIVTSGSLILSVLLLFRLSSYALFADSAPTELILALLALAFFFVGILFYRRFWSASATPTAEFRVDYKIISQLGISEREYEVLEKLNENISNREIADRLFLSESTVKTHVSNLLRKLAVRNRGALVERARALRLLPSRMEKE